MFHPFRSRLRDLRRRLTNSTRNQPTRFEERPARPVDVDGPTEWRIALPVQSPGYRAVRLGAARNSGGALYRGHAVGFDDSPGPLVRRYGRVPL